MQREEVLSLLNAYKRDFSEKYGIIEMGVFGSLARGEGGEDSDVDVFIKTRNPDPFNLVHIKDDLEHSQN